MSVIRQRLLAMAEAPFAAFTAKSIPNIPPETMLGVRTPALRQLAKELVKSGEGEAFLQELPHRYFEENQLHAFVLAEEKDFDRCLVRTQEFLPHIDNWATCDQFSPKVFRRHRAELLPYIRRWLSCDRTYTVRFGIKMLMDHFLDENFAPEYPAWVAAVHSEEYYVRMMQAWYFATALTKQWEEVFPCLEEKKLDAWVHNKSIQKAVESYRITPERKGILKALRLK